MFKSDCYKPTLLLILFALLLSGCESGGGNSNANQELDQSSDGASSIGVTEPDNINLQGRAVKGVISQGLVEVFEIENHTFNPQLPLASAMTDENGDFELDINALNSSAWVYIQISGATDNSTKAICDAENCGTFTAQDANDATPNHGLGDPIQFNDTYTLESNFKLGTIIQLDEIELLPEININPLTHMLAAQMLAASTEINADNIDKASKAILDDFELTEMTNIRDIRGLKSVDLTDNGEIANADTAEITASLISAAFHNVLYTEDREPIDIASAITILSNQGGKLSGGRAEKGSNSIHKPNLLETILFNINNSSIPEEIKGTILDFIKFQFEAITPDSYTLKLTETSGGQIILPESLDQSCKQEGCNLAKDVEITLTAIADSSFQFIRWDGDSCDSFETASESHCAMTMNQPRNATAIFEPKAITPDPTFTLTQKVVNEDNINSALVALSDGRNCESICAWEFSATESAELSAQLDESTSIRWELDGNATCRNQRVCNVIMDNNHILTAYFSSLNPPEPQTVSLTITINGIGTVSNPNLGISCEASCTKQIPLGSTITLQASTQESGYEFSGWSGLCNSSLTCIRQLESDSTIIANFNEIPDKKLDIKITGSGTVTSTQAGISCTRDCDYFLDRDMPITLTAEPALNQEFSGWGDGCAANPTPMQCTVDMSNHRLIVATFTESLLSATLTWQTPEQRENGTELQVSEIQLYKIYYGETSGDYFSKPIEVSVTSQGAPVEAIIPQLQAGRTYYIAMKTVDTSHRESSIFSEEISITME